MGHICSSTTSCPSDPTTVAPPTSLDSLALCWKSLFREGACRQGSWLWVQWCVVLLFVCKDPGLVAWLPAGGGLFPHLVLGEGSMPRRGPPPGVTEALIRHSRAQTSLSVCALGRAPGPARPKLSYPATYLSSQVGG